MQINSIFVFKKRTEIKNNFDEQIFANELRHHYNLRQPKGRKPTMVFLVVRINNQQVKISTGMKVYPMHWNINRAKECSGLPFLENNNNRLLNERLSLLDIRFDEYKRLVNEGIVSIDKEIFKEYIQTGTIMAKKQTKEKIDVARVLLSYLDKDTSIKDGTKDNYTRFIKSFGEFLSSQSIHGYEDITMALMKGFQQWCIENTKGRNGGRATGESVNKKVECTLKCIKRYLVGNGLISGSQFADIQIEPLKEVAIDDEIALRDDELTLLYKYQCENKRDEEIRDLFLLECTTGQRFSDVEKVADFVEHKDGRTYFNLIQDKGGAKVQVDIIFQMAIDILEKYAYKLPTYNKKIFNKRIKEIAKSAGIVGHELIRYHEADIAGVSTQTKERYKCISSHTGRRTFTTLLSLRGMNETEIARYTGHATLTMVRRYDKSKEGTKVKEMFERLKKEHPEQILQMVGDNCKKVEGDNTASELYKQIQQQAFLQLKQQEENANLNTRIRRQAGIIAIEKHIADISNHSLSDLKELLEFGMSYEEILKYYEERDRINAITDADDISQIRNDFEEE